LLCSKRADVDIRAPSVNFVGLFSYEIFVDQILPKSLYLCNFAGVVHFRDGAEKRRGETFGKAASPA
jgi:hypothetical protein